MSEQVPGILQGADSPRDVAKCAFVRMVPVRFALSSEEAPPVQGRLPAYMQAVPERKHLKYTLRLLRNGYIHVFHKALHSGTDTKGEALCPGSRPPAGNQGRL